MTLFMREQEIRAEIIEEITNRDIRIFVSTLKSFDIPNDAIVEHLIKNYNLTRDKANDYVKIIN